jgi:hypothetical protein
MYTIMNLCKKRLNEHDVLQSVYRAQGSHNVSPRICCEDLSTVKYLRMYVRTRVRTCVCMYVHAYVPAYGGFFHKPLTWVVFWNLICRVHLIQFTPVGQSGHNSRWLPSDLDAMDATAQRQRNNKRAADAWGSVLGGNNQVLQRRSTEQKFKGLYGDKPYYKTLIRTLLNGAAGAYQHPCQLRMHCFHCFL